jgi:hypothetical protein
MKTVVYIFDLGEDLIFNLISFNTLIAKFMKLTSNDSELRTWHVLSDYT